MPARYREFPAPPVLQAAIACTWETHAPQPRMQLIIPDGCVDLIWMGQRELVLAGADTGPRAVAVPAGARSVGIRLRPGASGSFLRMPASEIRDQLVPLSLVARQLAEQLLPALEGSSPQSARALLTAAVQQRGPQPDPAVQAAWIRLHRAPARVSVLAAELGLSERQLHRRVLAAVGYGPKTLARVARLRRLIELSEESLAARALSAGYASQAHMSDEVRALTGTTAVRFLEDAGLTAA